MSRNVLPIVSLPIFGEPADPEPVAEGSHGFVESRHRVTFERKLEIARRSYELLTGEYEIPPEDIWWDALVFRCATGEQTYIGSAARTIEGVREASVSALIFHHPDARYFSV